jgi:hypothetical protein
VTQKENETEPPLFEPNNLLAIVFKFLFIIMPLKMAALCLDASLETLGPLCYRGTHRLHGDLCRCLHKESLQTVRVVVTLLASHVLQNSPQFILRVMRSGLPEGQSSALIKAGTFLRSHS